MYKVYKLALWKPQWIIYLFSLWTFILECNLSFPASIINGVAVSKTFQILYRNEDVSINDVILFKVHMLVDSHRVSFPYTWHSPILVNAVCTDTRFNRLNMLQKITKNHENTPFPIATRQTLQWLKAELFSWEFCHTSITTRHTVIKTELFSWESCLCAKSCKQCI